MPISTSEKLHERIKELSCLYNISGVILQRNGVKETLDEICVIVRSAWRYAEDAFVRLNVRGINIETPDFPSRTVAQQSPIRIFNEVNGEISVHYDADKYSEQSFLFDEQLLLDKLAVEISEFYEKHLKDEELAVLKRRAERADRLTILGEITAGIAHELNTPLGNILGFAELINERTTDPQTRQDCSKVIKAAIYSREIVKKLMFFSCDMPQHMQVINIAPVAEQALTLLEPNFRKAGIISQFKIDDSNLKAQLDPIQLTQVLFNLLVNAIYVAPAGSTIETKIYSDDTFFYLEIADQGPGITPENREKIFEPFFTTKPLGEGNGLGLSVVHGIIKSHRGTITTFDNSPKGTVFKIRLPLNQKS